jgi:putative membrane protein
MTDNLEIFERLIFRIPSLSKLLPAIILLGSIYSGLFLLSTAAFTSIQIKLYYLPLTVILAFITPTLIASELFYFSFKDFPRKWSYALALINQTIFFIYSLILTGADNFTNAWRIFWIALLTLYLFNFFVLLITQGYRNIIKITTLSTTQPLTILVFFHLTIGKWIQMDPIRYLTSFPVIIVGAISFFTIFAISEYFIRVNVEDLSVLELIEGVIQKKEKKLDIGYPSKAEVQTLKIQNNEEEITVAVPWIHPGPIECFGGGQLTSKIIRKLNTDGKGFFFHVPSTHKSDLADPEDHKEVLKALEEPETTNKASKMIKKHYENADFYGRKIGGQKIVFMDAEYDDYEKSIFTEQINLENVLLVDLHDHKRYDRTEEIWHGTKKAEELRKHFQHFLEELEDLEAKHEYKSGFEVDLEERPVFTLVEDVGGQETLIFGVEGNGNSKEVREFKKEMSQKYNQVLFFSTDTHRSIHEHSQSKQVEKTRLKQATLSASKKVSKASIGFESQRTGEIQILGESHLGLIFTVNILTRLLLFSLILVYTGLVIWIFF